MSVRITIQAVGLNITADLKDDALITILQLIQEKRDESVTADPPASPATQRANSQVVGIEPTGASDSEESIKVTLSELGGGELLNQFKWENFPEKILLLAAWHEARGGTTPWRSSDMDDTFRLAKESPPSNFPRDIKNAIKLGWIHNETPRTYVVTRTGWNKIGQAMRGGNS